jgi:hypothetical protein
MQHIKENTITQRLANELADTYFGDNKPLQTVALSMLTFLLETSIDYYGGDEDWLYDELTAMVRFLYSEPKSDLIDSLFERISEFLEDHSY